MSLIKVVIFLKIFLSVVQADYGFDASTEISLEDMECFVKNNYMDYVTARVS